jgi:hypothetical protein
MKRGGIDVEAEGQLVRIGRLATDGCEFVEDPEALLADIVRIGSATDLFTFIKRCPATTPVYDCPMEWDNVASPLGLPNMPIVSGLCIGSLHWA